MQQPMAYARICKYKCVPLLTVPSKHCSRCSICEQFMSLALTCNMASSVRCAHRGAPHLEYHACIRRMSHSTSCHIGAHTADAQFGTPPGTSPADVPDHLGGTACAETRTSEHAAFSVRAGQMLSGSSSDRSCYNSQHMHEGAEMRRKMQH